MLQAGKCVQVDPQNCTEIDAQGRCLRCDADSYVVEATGECVLLPPDRRVRHCALYGAQMQCRECSSRFYLEPALNRCRTVARPIDRCLRHGPRGKTCVECQLGSFLAPDGSRCDLVAPPRSCGQASYLGCFSCAPGYEYNPRFRVEAASVLSKRAGTEQLAQVAE